MFDLADYNQTEELHILHSHLDHMFDLAGYNHSLSHLDHQVVGFVELVAGCNSHNHHHLLPVLFADLDIHHMVVGCTEWVDRGNLQVAYNHNPVAFVDQVGPNLSGDGLGNLVVNTHRHPLDFLNDSAKVL
ncbi:hypothetical protein Hanom_Chr13g01208761 [Helianthus anomalus]